MSSPVQPEERLTVPISFRTQFPYTSRGMAAIIVAAWRGYRHVFDDLRDTRSDDWFLMNSVWAPLTVVAFYLYFVYNLGPRLMKNRPPMQLDTRIKLYDIVQVVLNCYTLERVLRAVYIYFLIKMLDLLDMVFFILRKKEKQISFLHVYHHAGLFFGAWNVTKFLPDTRSDDWFLMNSVWAPLTVVAFYLYFIFNLGPQLMKNRPPMQLDTLIRLYDLVQVVLNSYILERSLTLGWATTYRWFCEPVDYSESPEAYAVLRAMYLYFLVKMLDLLDTVFFILRKKDKQISFLHVYHHAGVFFGAWIGTKFFPGGHGSFLGPTNSFIHIIMYLYYFVTNTWPQIKQNMWWKKYITQLQMVQFLLVSLHSAVALFITDCGFPKFVAGLMVFQYSFMFLLFLDFYKKAYSRKTD